MLFSEQCKKEWIEEEPPKNPCCRYALVYGLAFCARVEGQRMYFDFPNAEVATAAENALCGVLHAATESREIIQGRRRYVEVQVVSRRALSFLQKLSMSDLPLTELMDLKCEHCVRYFLRGVFTASAGITDPGHAYHLELHCRDEKSAAELITLLTSLGFPPKIIKRKRGVGLYYKDSAAIEDVLSYLHTHKALFALINSKINRDIRNAENRATNCDTRNIRRAVAASANQVAAIRALQNSLAWNHVPTALRETAELRLLHPDASMVELAAEHDPPITKSGLNHRMQKLVQMAQESAENAPSAAQNVPDTQKK